MRPIPAAAAAAALVLCAAAPAAQALTLADRYSSISFLGDSLSDTGNAFALSGGAFGGPPYFDGRFSDGPLWSDLVSAAFAPTAVANAAVGGATVLANATFPGNDLDGQRALYDSLVANPLFGFGPRPVLAIWIGANDVGAGNDMAAAAARVTAEVADLSVTYGIMDFLVPDLPDLGKWPGALAGGPVASAAATFLSELYNTALFAGLDALEAGTPGLQITRVRTADLFDAVLADPGGFGMPQGAAPCYIEGVFLCTDPEDRVFFDPIHPSSTMHALIAGAVEATVIPIPATLPLLAAAAAGLLLLRRRAA